MWIDLPPYRLWESRTGSGAPVALIHGLSGSTKWWSKNIDVLAATRQVAALDLVGFGRSQSFALLPKVIPRFTEATALLARWLESFGEPVHVIGHSMGGILAIRLAAERPDLVRSLVLVSAAGMPFAVRPGPHLRPIPRTPLTAASLVGQVIVRDVWRAGPTSIAVATGRILRNDARKWMRQITAPTLLVWGEHDAFVPLAYGRAMAGEIPGAKLEVIEGSAHVPMWETPDAFNRIVTKFLDEVESGERTSSKTSAADAVFSWGLAGVSEGMAWRQAGRRRDVVLVHGLGMASSYFARFARALYARGWNPIAPDLPGFGESTDAPASGPREHAEALAAWADRLSVRNASWIGHSTGCHAVAQLAAMRPDIVKNVISIAPLWTSRGYFRVRLLWMFVTDVFRENWKLIPVVTRAYWRAGVARWLLTYRAHFHDIVHGPSKLPHHEVIVGDADPIPDRPHLASHGLPVTIVAGAHACHFAYPDEVADAVSGLLRSGGSGAPSNEEPAGYSRAR